jgi:RNase adaptor protein for sRNA GlmZ degradation
MDPLKLKIETDNNVAILENPYFKKNLPPVNSTVPKVYDFLTPTNSAILGVPGGMVQEVANLWISKIENLKSVGSVT